MCQTSERLKPELAALPATEHAEIARFLIASLEPEEDADAETAWDLELARRVAEIQSGNAEGKPAAEVFTELRERYR
jgi:putative addiction module component (TIGR02574 family)